MLGLVELHALKLPVDLGTYGPEDVIPDEHLLDLTLEIDPGLVLIDTDEMERVFDYDPLVSEILNLARDGHYKTQERLMTRIAIACASYSQILSVGMKMYKTPVHEGTGSLGVRLQLDNDELGQLRGG